MSIHNVYVYTKTYVFQPLTHPITKRKCMFTHTLPVHGVGYSHTHTHAHFLSLQDYDMLLIATIISDSLPENWALLWGREARCRRIQKSERERERERTETQRGKGHIEGVNE